MVANNRASKAVGTIAASAAGVAVLYLIQIWATKNYVAHFGIHPVGLSSGHSAIMLACAALQTALLAVIYRQIPQVRNVPPVVIAVPAVVLAIASFFTPTPQGDAYSYILYAKLGGYWGAYVHSIPIHPPAGFETNLWTGLPPAPYGPLWVFVNWILVGATGNFATALFVLRIFAVVLIAGLVYALKKCGANNGTLAVVALNPFLYFYFVVEVHNDLLALVLIFAGMAISTRRPVAGAILAGAGALVKLPYALGTTLAFDRSRQSLRTMVIQLGVAILTILIASIAFGGAAYWHALSYHATSEFGVGDARLHVIFEISHILVTLIAFVATAAAFFANFFLPVAAYSFYGVAASVYPWYLSYGIPYAVRMPQFAGIFFASLPVVSTVIDPQCTFYRSHPWTIVDLFSVAIVVAAVAQLLAQRRRSIEGGEPMQGVPSH